IVILTATILIASNVTVFASTVNNKENQIKENQESIQNLQRDKLELSNEKQKLNGDLQIIIEQFASVAKEVDALRAAITQKESEIHSRENSIIELDNKINLLEKEIETKLNEISEREVELAEKNAILDSRVRSSYMNSSAGNIIFTLFESESLVDFTDRLVMIRKIVDLDKEIIQQVNVIKAELTVRKADLEVNKKDSMDSKAVVEAEKSKLVEDKTKLDAENQTYTAKLEDIKNLEANKEAAVNALTMEEMEVASDIGDMIEENEDLQNEIKALIRAEAAKNKASLSNSASSSNIAGASAKGYIKPVAGRVSSSFGYRIHPILGYRKLHTGIDFAASSGTSIRATRGGTVIRASYNSSYGNNVIIDHGNGVTTLYAHMSKLNTGYGAKVAQGQVIGYVGSTGMSTGPHLHLEFRLNGNLVNPAPYLGL
ncbi:MAG TPA: peptidoglycan DD-metalloendopeptidase family protein, partial [Clostridiaceae bacterium]|nr:peptidoglycan DD-metalloendopeptidase family protein [Clostridiaceae bacterium]